MRSYAVATLVVFALWLADTARAQGSDWPAPLPAQASAQQATTEQAGMTSADATDAQPTNILVSLRINSPGDNGPVSQTSTTAVAGDAANDAATAQDGWQDWDSDHQAGEGQPQAARQDSGTDQAATATAAAPRPQKLARGGIADPSASAPKQQAASPVTAAPASCVSVGPSPAERAATRV